MIRRSHGVNLDDGVALSSREDFDRLHVTARPEEVQRLQDWYSDPAAGAIVLAGQIGTGTTTLLNEVLRSAADHTFIRVEFDRVPIDEEPGALLAVLFGSVLGAAIDLGCSCTGIGVALSDFGETSLSDWEKLRDLLLKAPSTFADKERVRGVYKLIGENGLQGRNVCSELIRRIEAELGAKPPIIAEGVDKFAVSTAGYLGLVETLNFLSEHKTLFEANAVHFFDSGRKWVESDKLFIGPLPDETIVEMFEKRLGSYATFYRKEFSPLVELSGGNARQALRLLNAYYYYRTQRRNDEAAALAISVHRVTQDHLQFGFTKFPANMMMVFKRDGYVEAGGLTSPVTESVQDARDILCRNWAFLLASPAPGTTRWPVISNPLVSDAVAWEKTSPEPPELTAARRWARDHNMSPMGMGIPVDEQQRPLQWERVWTELSSSESSEDELKVVGLLEEVASSLFSTNRQDRIFVSYRDPTNLNVAIDYLIGKAASYGPFTCREVQLVGGEAGDRDPVANLIMQTMEENSAIYTVFAVFMEGTWTAALASVPPIVPLLCP